MTQNQTAVVVGSFVDKEHNLWGPKAKAFSTVQDAIGYLDARGKPDGATETTEQARQGHSVDGISLAADEDGIDALIHVLRVNPMVAIKTFRTRHDANSFVSLIEQMATQRSRAKVGRLAIAS